MYKLEIFDKEDKIIISKDFENQNLKDLLDYVRFLKEKKVKIKVWETASLNI